MEMEVDRSHGTSDTYRSSEANEGGRSVEGHLNAVDGEVKAEAL